MDIAFGVVSTPFSILIIGGIQIQEVGEEPACRHLTSQLIEVKVTVFWQIVHATLLFPYLDGEDSRFAITHTFVSGKQDFAHDATTFCTRIRTIVDTGEHHLVTTTRMDGVHIVDEGLHSLMHPAYRLVDGMLLCTFPTL